MSSGLTGARSASEESMWRVHGRKGENLKLGNSCVSVFSQIFHRNRSIGALGHKHIASRFHHSGKQQHLLTTRSSFALL